MLLKFKSRPDILERWAMHELDALTKFWRKVPSDTPQIERLTGNIFRIGRKLQKSMPEPSGH